MATLTVGTGGTFVTIQAAIDVAADGDVIIVSAGTYNEDLTINKGVTIQGANQGVNGTGVRSAETIITGQSSITTSSQVTIDGVEFLDNKPLTSLTSSDTFVALKILAQAATATGHVIENSIFMRDPSTITAPGFDANTFTGSSLQPTHRAIEISSVGAGTAVTIANNLITGDNPYSYAGDDWRSGVYSNGGAGDTYIQNNTFTNTRSGINADDFAPTVHITGNSFDHSGTGIAVGVGSNVANVTTITNNAFGIGVDAEFNFRNLTTGVTFDAQTTGNYLSPAAVAANETFFVETGSGSDHVTGTGGSDVFVATAGDGNDSYDGGLGIDTVNYSAINGAGAQIIVNLASGTANGSVAGSGSDTLVSIENVIGTQLGDSLTGDSNNNRLEGRGGEDDIRGGAANDTLIGGAGNDDLRGGADDDTAIFAATAADGIATQAGGVLTINAGVDGTDTVQTVEHLVFLGADGVAGGTGANEDITIDVDASGNAQAYARNDSGSAVEDGVNASGNVLTNDINIDEGVGDQKTVTAVNGSAGGVGNGVSGSYGTLNLSSNGSYTYVPTGAVQSLGVDDVVTDTFTYAVDDGSGHPATANLVITITGNNDAPTVNAGGDATGVYAGGALDNVVTADVATNNRFEPVQQVDVAAMLNPDPTAIDMDAVLTAIQGQLPAGSGRADAIAIVWDYIDDNYSYYNTYINSVSAFLSIEYAKYLEGGGKPLLDVIVKYTPDGGDVGTAPDRVQSLHDNLLGNLWAQALVDRLSDGGSNPAPNEAAYQAILAKLATEGLSDLVNRPYYDGNEGSANNALGYDQAHGLAGGAGQLVATDVDGDTMTWSGNANGIYGTFAIAADGKWTYTVDNTRPATKALSEGQAVTESFTATVTDQNNATATQVVTVTVNGSNDIAQLGGFRQGFESDSAGIVAGGGYGTVTNIDEASTTLQTPDGSHYAILTEAGGSGPFTRFDGYRATFTDGLTSGVKVYLDTSWADNEGFEYSVAANGADGNHQRDFVFHVVSQGAGALHVGGNNNAGFNSNDPAAGSVAITQSGWYTLQHVFHDVGGVLSVDLNLVAEDGTVTHIATLSNALDTIPAEVGGNRYGWFTSIDVAGGIAVDTVTLGDSIGRVVEDSGSYSVDGLLPFSDVDALDTHSVEVASPVDHLGTLTASVTEAAGGHGGAVTWHYTVDNADINHLAEGQVATETYTLTLVDNHGGRSTKDVTITITGTNDAPTVNAGGDATGVYAGGALDNVVTADVATNNRFEPVQQIDVAAMLNPDPTAIDMDAVLTAIQGQLPAGSGRADAIAIVWDYIDDNYSYYNTYINSVSAFLAIEYAKYLEGGGKPLLDVIVKYTPDGGDVGTAPDRVQSLHDNLLGNVWAQALVDRLSDGGSNPAPNEAAYQAILAKLATEGLSDLVNRPYYDGNEGSANNALGYDQAHGLAGGAGQLVATDVDGDTMTWSGNANGIYGTFAIAADGKWTYTVDNTRSATKALSEGQAVTESFTATVTDQNNATATQVVTVTVNGSNDIAQLGGFRQGFESDSAGIVASAGYGTVTNVDEATTSLKTPDGSHYAILTEAGGSGPFTRFDGYRATFTDGLTSGVKVYLDTSWGDNQGFEYSVAANGADGNHQRDFVFHVVSEGLGTLHVGGNNNAGFNSNSPAAGSVVVTQSGWYTLQHVFHDVGGVLSVDLNLVAEDGTVTHIATLSNAADTIPAEVGGNRYGWFTSIDVAGGIAVDTVTLGDSIGHVVEDSGSYSVDGLLPFSDVDALDTHSVEVASPVGHLGTLTASVTEAAGGHGGAVTWHYTVNNSAIDHLAQDEVATETYTLTLIDNHGGRSTKDVVITITGTNDAPTIDAVIETVTDTAAADPFATLSGTLVGDDVDDDATLTYAIDGVTPAGDGSTSVTSSYGTLTVHADGSYDYVPNAGAINALPAGSNPADLFAVKVTDNHGVETTATLTVNITGANDTPIITSSTSTQDVEEGTGTVSGSVVADVNATDAEGASLVYSLDDNFDGRFAIDPATGVITIPAGAGLLFDYEQQASYTLGVSVSDGVGGVAHQTLTVDVTDVNPESFTLPAGPRAGLTVSGGAGDDTFTTTYRAVDGSNLGPDTINGSGGHDTLVVNFTSGDDGAVGPATVKLGTGADAGYALIDVNGDGATDIRVTGVEDITFNMGGGHDTLNLSGHLTDAGVSPNTITVNLGAGNDTFNATGSNVDHDVDGEGGNDEITGGDINDILKGGTGDDTFHAGLGSDQIHGGAVGADDANATIDTATYDAGASISWNGTNWQVNKGAAGTDTLHGIERVVINGETFWLVDNDSANGGLNLQGAIDEAGASDVILLSSQTNSESVTINHAVTIRGVNNASVAGTASRGAESVLTGTMTVTAASGLVTFDGIKIFNTSSNSAEHHGIDVQGAADVTVTNSIFSSDQANGNNVGAWGDVAIYVGTAASGSVHVIDNLFTTDVFPLPASYYGGAAWNRGIITETDATTLTVTGNSFNYLRTGIGVLGNASDTISGNEFSHSGTGISLGGPVTTPIVQIVNNTFDTVDADFNIRTTYNGFTFDAEAHGNASQSGQVTVILGGDFDDTITGTQGDDYIAGDASANSLGTDYGAGSANSDANILKGMGGNDTLLGSTGADTAVYVDTRDNHLVTVITNPTGFVTGFASVQDIDTASGSTPNEGTDTLFSIERIEFSDQTLDLTQPIQVMRGGVLVATYSSIQDAIDNAGTLSGDTIFVDDGVYDGVTLNKAVNLVSMHGAATTVITSLSGGNGITLTGDLNAGGSASVKISGFTFSSNNVGVSVASSTNLDSLVVENSAFIGNKANGVGMGSGAPNLDDIQITDSTFAQNGDGTFNGDGDISLFGFHGDALIKNVTIEGGGNPVPTNGNADFAIQINGRNPTTHDVSHEIGNVVIENVDISGSYAKVLFYVQGYTGLNDLDFSQGAGTSVQGHAGWGYAFYIDETAGEVAPQFTTGVDDIIDLSNVTVSNDIAINVPIGHPLHALNGQVVGALVNGTPADNTVFGTTADDVFVGGAGADTFDGADGTDIALYASTITGADVSYDSLSGSWVVDAGAEGIDHLQGVEQIVGGDGHHVFLVNDGDSINAAIALANPGDTIVIAAGTYNETVDLNKAVTLVGANQTVDGNGVRGDESIITGGVLVSANGATIIGFQIEGQAGPYPSGIYIQANDFTITNSILDGCSCVGGGAHAFTTQAGVIGLDFQNNLVTDWDEGAYITEGTTGVIANNHFSDMHSNSIVTESVVMQINGNDFANGWNAHVVVASGSSTVDLTTFIDALNTFDDPLNALTPISVYPNAIGAETIIGTDNAELIRGGNYAPNYVGNSPGPFTIDAAGGDDIIFASAGNDDITGGADNDYIFAGLGTDTARYTGQRSDYVFIQAPDGAVYVSDSRPGGPDGFDTLYGVETFVFTDGTFTLADVLDHAPTAAPDLFAATEDVTLNTGNVLTNDYDPDASGDTLVVSAVNGAAVNVGAAVTGVYGTLTLNADGTFTYLPNTALAEALALGAHGIDTFSYATTDSHGKSSMTSVVFNVTGTNDAPVVSVGGNTTTVYAGGALDNVVTADVAGDHKFEPVAQIDVAAMLAADPTTIDMDAVLTAIQSQLPSGSSRADAIAIVWDYVDDNYSYLNNYINTVSAFLGIEYAKYLQDGGTPLLDVIVKYTVDGGDAGTAPDRVQSMHDNLLGNLWGPALIDRLSASGSNPAPSEVNYQAILAKLATEDLSDLLTRPYYSGNEGSANNALTFDQANDLVHGTGQGTGQLVATDIDVGDTLSWSGGGSGIYGTFAIVADGTWTYTVDNSLAKTKALAEGETATDTFTATVTDQNGATDTQIVTVTVTGSNDLAKFGGFTQGFETNTADILTTLGGNDYGTVTRVASHVSPSGTITAADGGSFAVITDNFPGSDDGTGPFTRFDGYRSTFTDGLTTGVKVYLDTNWSTGEGFDYSVATNGANGVHLRDFVFHVSKSASGLLVGASTGSSNTTPADLTGDPGHGTIASSGWYTLQHVFNDVGGFLSVDLNVVDANGVVVFTETIAVGDAIANVGGNRYGWFTLVDVANGIAVDAVTLGDVVGDVFEDGVNTSSGFIPFTDVDLQDHHSISVVPGSGTLGTLTASVSDASTGDGAGAVSWNYAVNNAAIQYLAAGQTKTETFTLTLTDSAGGQITKDVTVTITGTNDSPVVDVAHSVAGATFSEIAGITGSGQPRTQAGSVFFTDLDSTDTLTLQPLGAVTVVWKDAGNNDVSAQLTAGQIALLSGLTASLAGSGTNVHADWSYSVTESSLDFLGLGETITVTRTVTVSDGNGGTASQLITVTINGRNDAPTVANDPAAVNENLTVAPVTGVIGNDSDPDAHDAGTLRVSAVSSNANGNSGALATVGSQQIIVGAFGTLTIHGDGTYSYSADQAEFLAQGQLVNDNFTVTVIDNHGASSLSRTEQLSIAVTGQNDAPVAVADTKSVNENATAIGNVLTNDTDIDNNNVLSVASINNGSGAQAVPSGGSVTLNGLHGTLTINADGSYGYLATNDTLADGVVVTDTFTYATKDAGGATSGTATLTITVTGTNDAPVAMADIAGILEDAVSTSGNVLTNDTDVDVGDTHTVATVNNLAGNVGSSVTGTYGALVLNSNGTYTYTLNNALASVQALAVGQQVTDTFTYTNVDNETGVSNSTTLTVTVTGTNDAPVVVADAAAVTEDTDTGAKPNPVSGNVLTNDTDVDVGDTRTVSTVAGSTGNVGNDVAGTYGTLRLNSNGSYTYTLNNALAAVQALAAGQFVTEVFAYTAIDNQGGVSAPGNLTITVNGTNDAPVAVADFATISEDDAPIVGNVLGNDTDVDLLDTHTVLTVDGLSGNVGQDVAGTYGTLHLNADGSATYTLNNALASVQALAAGQQVTDTFTYTNGDNHSGVSNSTTLTVTITGTNDAPVAVVDTAGINEDVVSTSGNVLTNDTDVDAGDTHTVSAVNGSAGGVGNSVAGTYGTLVLNSNGSYTYTLANGQANVQALAAGQQVTDVFTYVNTDNHLGVSNTANLTVTVTGANDAPVAVANTATINEDAVSTAGNVLTNDTDVDTGDTHTVATVNGLAGNVGSSVTGTYGTLVLNGDGTYTYTLNNALASVQALAQGQQVTDVFTYTNADNQGGVSGSANLTVTVTGTNDAPVAVADVAAATEGGSPVAGNVLTNDTDVDTTDTHTVSAVNGLAGNVGTDVVGTYGTLHLNSNGTYTYTVANNQANVQALAAGQQVTDVFTYVNSDNHSGVSNTANLTVTVTGTNPAPEITTFSNDTGVKGDNITADTTLQLSGTADANSKIVIFDGPSQIGIIFADGTGAWSFNTATLAVGFHTFSAVAYDAQNHASAASTPLVIQVDPAAANHAPTATAANFPIVQDQTIAMSTHVSATDADGDAITRYQFWDDNTNSGAADDNPSLASDQSGYFTVNGIRQNSGTAIEVTDLSTVSFTAGGVNDILWVRASDAQGFGAWTRFDATETRHANSINNVGPDILVANLTAATKGQVFTEPQFVTAASDVNGDPIYRYRFWDDNGTTSAADDNPATDNTGYFMLNGVRMNAGVSIEVNTADLANFAFKTTSGTDILWAQAYDGQTWGAWKQFTITGAANAIPTVTPTSTNLTIAKSSQVAANALFTAVDSNGDAITQVQFRDMTDTATSGYFVVNGVAKAGTGTITLSQADLASTYFQAGNGSSDSLAVRVFDGYQWSNWSNFAVNAPNNAPVVTLANSGNATIASGQTSVSASTLFGLPTSVTDSDGDAITKYQFWDDNQTTSAADDRPATDNTGYFTVNGIRQSAGTTIEVSAAQLASTNFLKATAGGQEVLWVRAYDGTTWGNWQKLNVTESANTDDPGNHAPVALVHDIAAASHGVTLSASSLFSSADADGDAVTRVQFWDDHRASGTADDNPLVDTSGHFVMNGTTLAEGQALDFAISDLGSLTFQTGSGSDLIYARVFDGDAWGNWVSFHVNAPIDHAPVVTGSSNISLVNNQVVSAQTLFNTTDVDGDQIVKYQFWDGTPAANSAHFTIDGAPQQTGIGIDVLAADLSHVSVTAASVAETDQMWVRAFDGTMWSDWHPFSITSH